MALSRRQIVLLVVLMVACFGVAGWLWRHAFPLATLEFRVNRGEAQAQLARFVTGLGHPLDGYRAVASFGEDTGTKNFLELEHGIPRLETMTRDGVNIWYWSVRWFKPEQHEEFTASIDPQGRFVGYDHTIEEERALPSLERPAALALAEDFVRRHATHHPWARLRFVSDSNTKRTNRLDWQFEWEREDLRLGDARYRIHCGVHGNEIGDYSEALDVPEAWTRSFAEKREVNELCGTIAGWALLPITIGAFVFFIIYGRRGELRWRDVAPRTWLAVFALSVLASQVNEFPALLAQYDTTQKWGSFLSESAFSTLRGMLAAACGFWLLLLVADPLYREMLPQHLSFRRALSARALDDPRTLRALGLGIVLAAVGLAYVTTFYVVSRHFGAWSPVEIDYTKTLSGWLPWAEAMQTGLTAASSEEMLFRVIGVLLYLKLLRRWPIALVLAGATWGFLHSSYPQMPGYIRGVELTLVGVFWGYIMKRFGVVCTLTAHYLYDCWLGSFVVLQSAAWQDKLGALAVSLWPVALFGYALWRRARGHALSHLVEEIADPAAQPLPPAEASPPLGWNIAPVRLAPRRRWIVAGAGLLLCVAVALLPLPQDVLRKLGIVDLRRGAIAAKSDEIMRGRGLAPERFRRIISLSNSSFPATYLLEHGSLADLAKLYETVWPDLTWHIRYFRIMEREEYALQLDKSGRLVSWQHSAPREAPGAQLERDAALAIARQALEHDHRADLAQETLVAESTTEEVHRRDHHFTFERAGWQRGEAKLRTSISVQGDEPVGFYRWIKVPEAWALARAKSGWRSHVVSELGTWIGIGKGIALATLFVLLLTRHLVPWRLGFLLAIVPTAMSLLERVNSAPWFFAGYQTTTPLASFLFQAWGSLLVGVVMGYLGEVLRVSVALGFVAWAFGWRLRDFTWWPATREERSAFWGTTMALFAASLALYALESYAESLATGTWFPDRAAYFSYPEVNVAWPWLLALTNAFDSAWSGTLRVATMSAVLALLWRRFPRLTVAVLLLQPLLDAASARDWPSFAYGAVVGEVELLFILGLVVYLWRANVVLIFLYYFLAALLSSLLQFLAKGGPGYRWEAAPLLGLLALAVAAGWLAHRRTIERLPPVVS